MNSVSTDLNLLVALDALLRERNITRAGAHLGVAQSTMSAALARLRRQFSDELLIRVGGRYELTPLALVLASRVREVMDAVERTLTAAPEFNAATSNREFSVLTSDYASAVLLPALMPRLRTEAPNVRLRLELISPAVLEAPEDALGRCDLLIIPRGYLDGYPSAYLFDDEWVCVTGVPSGPETGPVATRWVRVFSAAGATDADRALDRMGPGARVDVVIDAFSTIPSVLAGSDLQAFAQHRLVAPALRSGLLRILPSPAQLPQLQEAAWWHGRKDADPGHRWFRELVRQVARELPPCPAPEEAARQSGSGGGDAGVVEEGGTGGGRDAQPGASAAALSDPPGAGLR